MPNESLAVKTMGKNVTLLARVVDLDRVEFGRITREPLTLREVFRVEDATPVLVNPT